MAETYMFVHSSQLWTKKTWQVIVHSVSVIIIHLGGYARRFKPTTLCCYCCFPYYFYLVIVKFYSLLLKFSALLNKDIVCREWSCIENTILHLIFFKWKPIKEKWSAIEKTNIFYWIRKGIFHPRRFTWSKMGIFKLIKQWVWFYDC